MARELTAIATGNPLAGLTDMQKLFIQCVVNGQSQTLAARSAGYAHPAVEACNLMKNPRIVEALHYMHRKHEKASQMTRKKVMDGLLEAIEMAKQQADPDVMVSGWREIGRMCGYYAAERKIIDVNVTAKRAVDRLEMMSDEDLLQMIETDSQAIEGEFSEVLQTTQIQADAEFVAAGYDG